MIDLRRSDPKERVERFHEMYIPVTESGCWIWLGTTDRTGYGSYCANGKTIRAHRFSYQAFRGPIPNGLFVCHSCDVRSCVNPDHLWLGTALDNSRDRDAKGRFSYWQVPKTHCPKGHALSGENLIAKRGRRECRRCKNDYMRIYNRRPSHDAG